MNSKIIPFHAICFFSFFRSETGDPTALYVTWVGIHLLTRKHRLNFTSSCKPFLYVAFEIFHLTKMLNLMTPDPAQLNWNAVERESESSILLQTHLQRTGPVFFQWESNKFVSFYKRLTSHVTTAYGGICFCPFSLGTSWCCQNNF